MRNLKTATGEGVFKVVNHANDESSSTTECTSILKKCSTTTNS